MANIKQVAEMSGVSTATVSKYLNGVKLKEKNRIEVEKAIKELGYKINHTARGLRTNKSMTIGVLIPELDNLFSTSIISNIENIIMKKGYSTIICDYKSDRELEIKKLNFLLDRMVDGIIILPYYLKKEDLENIDIPLVFIDRKIENADFDYVLVDNFGASYQVTEHLIENGHKNIGILLGPKEIYTSKERYKGYEKVFLDYNLPLIDEYIVNGDYDMKTGHDLTAKLLDLRHPPTAIYATNYELTLGAIIALNERNIVIPDEISFVGFDNLEMAKIVKPNITIVTQPIEEIGKEIAKTILQRIEENQNLKNTIILKTNLIKQNSVRKM